MNDDFYKKEMKYIPFKSRVWAKFSLLLYPMLLLLVFFLVISIVSNDFILMVAFPIAAIVMLVYYFICEHRMKYFLQCIRIDQGKTVYLDLYLKDENQCIQLPLHQLQVKLERNRGKNRYTLLNFYNQRQSLGFQFNFRRWTPDRIVEVFTKIKALKEEALTKQEKRMLKNDFLD